MKNILVAFFRNNGNLVVYKKWLFYRSVSLGESGVDRKKECSCWRIMIKQLFWWWGCRILPLRQLHHSRHQPSRSFPGEHCRQSVLPNPWRPFWGPWGQWILNRINFTGLLAVEGDEHFVDLISWFVVAGSGGHHVEELGEFDLSTSIWVKLSDHLIDSLGLGLDTERIDGNFEF